MLAVLAALTLLAAPADTLPGAIRGSVQSEPTGVPLVFAVVQVESEGRVLDTVTDSAGGYRLRRVPAGRHLLRVRHLDHAPLELEVLVPAGAEVSLDFALKPRPIALAEVVVQGAAPGGAGDTAVATHGELAMVSSRALEAGAAVAGAGLGHEGGGSHGGGEGQDPGDVLYVRGSSADLKLVLLDGAPVYAPFHMGGLIPTFEPEALGSARLYLGGAPARYDGGLSYVLDMRTRAGRPEHPRLAGAADLLSGRLLAEGPLPGGAAFLATGRAVHGGAVERLEGEPFPYGYNEGLARLDLPLPGGSELGATAFVNREEVRVDSLSSRDPTARWGNAAGSLRWRGPLLGSQAEATAALTGFRARLPWRTASRAMVMEAAIGRARGALDLSRSVWGAQLRYGLSYDRLWVEHEAGLREVEGEPIRLRSDSRGDAGGVYVDAAWQPRPRLAMRAGMRGDVFSIGTTLSLSPRLSATWLLGEGAALTVAGGRYHQYVRQAGAADPARGTVGAPGNFGDSLGVGTRLAVSRATHAALALDQQLGDGLRLGLEGYFKHFEGLPPGDRTRSYHSGVDVWARRVAGPVSGWLGYSLGWSWSEDDDAAWGTRRFAGRHLLSAGVAGEIGRHGRFGARMAYGAGLPYTAVYGTAPGAPEGLTGSSTPRGGTTLDSSAEEGGAPLSGAPRDPYLRVDVEVSRTWTPRWGSRRAELTPYLRVLNALDRRDGLFYRYDASGTGTRSVATLPLLPVAGLSFRF